MTDSSSWSFPGCPAPDQPGIDWPSLVERFDWLRAMDGCPQDPVVHREGDVFIHTRLVVETLIADERWQALRPDDRSVLFAAALLHDAGKPSSTVVDAASGRVSSRGHAKKGMRLARRMLYRGDDVDPAPFALREAIVALVRFHGMPLRAFDASDPTRAVIAASQVVRLDQLALLAEADVRGRVCDDQRELIERVALFRELGREAGSLDGPRSFPSDLARFAYLTGGSSDPDYEPFDDSRCDVVLMSGLPGAGKTRWVGTHLPDWPAIRLDDLRRTLAVDPSDDQGIVIAWAKDLAREHLRAGRSFVWDATNVSRSLRTSLVTLFASYHARVRIVYIEAPYAEVNRRNRARSLPVPDAVIGRLIDRLDVPEAGEAHRVEWVVE